MILSAHGFKPTKVAQELDIQRLTTGLHHRFCLSPFSLELQISSQDLPNARAVITANANSEVNAVWTNCNSQIIFFIPDYFLFRIM